MRSVKYVAKVPINPKNEEEETK